MLGYTITRDAITVVHEGEAVTVTSKEPTHADLLKALLAEDWDQAVYFLSLNNIIVDMTDGDVAIEDGCVLYQGFEVHSTVAREILKLVEEGQNVTPLMRFLARVENNPLISARNETFDFLQAHGFHIDEDGYIIAYKSVRENYTDHHSGEMDNSVGATVTEDRARCSTDRNVACAPGLHFATWGYANTFGGNSARIMVVRVDPADITSIPKDHSNQKARAWRYVIVSEITDGKPYEKRTFLKADFPIQDTPDQNDDPTNTRAGILQALKAANWQIGGPAGAANALGIPESTLRGRMKRLNIHRKDAVISQSDTSKVSVKKHPSETKTGLREALRKAKGKLGGVGGAAALLGVPESTLRGRMKKLGITRESFIK